MILPSCTGTACNSPQLLFGKHLTAQLLQIGAERNEEGRQSIKGTLNTRKRKGEMRYVASRFVLEIQLTEQAETKLKSVLTSGFPKAESYSAPAYQHTQVTITPERKRGRTLVSYNFLLLIFLIVIHWVFPGLGRSASILKNTESQTLLTVPHPTSIPSQGYSSLALEPQVWKTELQIRNQGSAERP